LLSCLFHFEHNDGGKSAKDKKKEIAERTDVSFQRRGGGGERGKEKTSAHAAFSSH